MPSKFLLSFLKWSVTVLFYLLIFFTLCSFVVSILKITGNNSGKGKKFIQYDYTNEVMPFGKIEKEKESFTYSMDSLVRYQGVMDRYTLEVDPNSLIGYYSMVKQFILLGIGIMILWNFKKIFRETNLEHPFKYGMTKRLKMLAALFIFSDILKISNYLLFNRLVQQSIPAPNFQLVTTIGNGIITGSIIWIIAIIYQQGIALQDENALTI